eukprot:4468557-Amphidinium_carterae.2
MPSKQQNKIHLPRGLSLDAFTMARNYACSGTYDVGSPTAASHGEVLMACQGPSMALHKRRIFCSTAPPQDQTLSLPADGDPA